MLVCPGPDVDSLASPALSMTLTAGKVVAGKEAAGKEAAGKEAAGGTSTPKTGAVSRSFLCLGKDCY